VASERLGRERSISVPDHAAPAAAAAVARQGRQHRIYRMISTTSRGWWPGREGWRMETGTLGFSSANRFCRTGPTKIAPLCEQRIASTRYGLMRIPRTGRRLEANPSQDATAFPSQFLIGRTTSLAQRDEPGGYASSSATRPAERRRGARQRRWSRTMLPRHTQHPSRGFWAQRWPLGLRPG